MARGRGMRAMVGALGLALAIGLVAPSIGRGDAHSPPAKLLWSKDRHFIIPVTLSAKNPSRVRELFLFASDDLGEHWKRVGRTTPDILQFPFRAPRDGEYWFAVQTKDADGKLFPNGEKQVEPTLRVIVDSTRPTILLEPAVRRGSEAGVRWEVQDDHLVLGTLTLEYQAEGVSGWRQVPLESTEKKYIGIKTWDAMTPDAIRARMSVRDLAGNVQTVEAILPDGLAANSAPTTAPRPAPPQITPIAGRPSAGPIEEPDPFSAVDGSSSSPAPAPASAPPRSEFVPAPAPLPPSRDRDRDAGFEPAETAPPTRPAPRPGDGAAPPRLIGSPKLALKYEVEDAGPEGPALVELYTTRDFGRTWQRHPEDPDRVSPYNVDLGGEGTFGLWLVVQSASGLGDSPPGPNDRPQSWVEVDASPPVVTMDRPRVGTGANAGRVLITWRASDTHLAPKSIALFYRAADRPDAPWLPIAQGLDNNAGRHLWTVPANLPPRFHIKVEAADTVGNTGAADTQEFGGPIILDRAKPKGRIVGLDAGAGTMR